LKRSDPDIVVFGTTPFPDEPKASDWHYRVLTTPDEYLPSIDAETLLVKPYLKVYIWRCCFKREFLTKNGISFDENCKYGEDALFTFEAMPKARGVAVISDKLYRYRHFRPDSLMYSIGRDPISRCAEQIHILTELLHISQRVHIPASKEFAAYCLDFIFSCIDACPEPEKTEYAVELYKLFRKFKLDVCIKELSSQYRGFWHEGIEKARRRMRHRRFLFKVIARLPRRYTFLKSVEALNQRFDSLERKVDELKNWYANDDVGRVKASLDELKKWYIDNDVGKIYKRFEQMEVEQTQTSKRKYR
jgi:hypothetical protein